MRKKFIDDKKEKTAETSGRKNTLKLSKEWEEQYIARTERREKELFGGKQPKEREVSDDEIEESYQKLVNSLKEKGIYSEDESKIIPISEVRSSGKEDTFAESGRRRKKKAEKVLQGRYRSSIHLGKIAGIALVCCACVFAASMTSEANRAYFVKNVRYLMGDDTRIILDNDDTNESADMEEYQAVQDIEEKLGIDMPEFYYRPQGLEFRGYEVNQEVSIARIEYQYQDKIILLLIDQQSEDRASNINSVHGEEVQTMVTSSDGIKVNIEKIQDSKDKEAGFMAQWQRDDVFYYLSGKMDITDLKKMLEQMKF